MKITINGSPKELAELVKVLGGTENKAKKADFPPLLTELAENENTNMLFGDGHIKTSDEIAAIIKRNHEIINKFAEAVRNAGKENAPQVEAAERDIPFIHFKPRFEEWIRIVREANAGKENAPQAEAAEQKKKQEVFEKQMELLSKASKDCLLDMSLYQYLPALTQAMILIEFLRA